jgi:hypothetical protein
MVRVSPSVWGLCRKIVSVCYDDILPVLFPGQQVVGGKVDSFELTFSPLPLKKERKKSASSAYHCISQQRNHCILFVFKMQDIHFKEQC